MAQTERNDWHISTETGGTVYSEKVALLMRRMHLPNNTKSNNRYKTIIDKKDEVNLSEISKEVINY